MRYRYSQGDNDDHDEAKLMKVIVIRRMGHIKEAL